MTDDAKTNSILEASGALHLFRTFGMALHPPKLGIALLAILATFLVGGLLDVLYKMGDNGLDVTAIDSYAAALALDRPYDEPSGESGVFGVWLVHEQKSVESFLGAVVPGWKTTISPRLGPATMGVGVMASLQSGAIGFCWLVSCHPIFCVLLGLSLLPIWATAGGAICRIATVQFTQGEKPTMLQGLRYAKKNLLGGFVLAPCIPLIGAAGVTLVLIIGGVVLRIPFLGDLVSGPLFVLAILGGFIVAALLVGLVVGGSLFWPAIAAEGQDAYDAFSRGMSYAMTRPWKTVIYAVLLSVLAGVCWQIVKLATLAGLGATRAIVSFGTSPFGWWTRGTEEAPATKLSLLWPTGGPGEIYQTPVWGALSWYECVSAFFIGLFVIATLATMWAFLVSFYFSGSSIVYFLLRRDVDGIDLEDLYTEDETLPATTTESATNTESAAD